MNFNLYSRNYNFKFMQHSFLTMLILLSLAATLFEGKQVTPFRELNKSTEYLVLKVLTTGLGLLNFIRFYSLGSVRYDEKREMLIIKSKGTFSIILLIIAKSGELSYLLYYLWDVFTFDNQIEDFDKTWYHMLTSMTTLGLYLLILFSHLFIQSRISEQDGIVWYSFGQKIKSFEGFLAPFLLLFCAFDQYFMQSRFITSFYKIVLLWVFYKYLRQLHGEKMRSFRASLFTIISQLRYILMLALLLIYFNIAFLANFTAADGDIYQLVYTNNFRWVMPLAVSVISARSKYFIRHGNYIAAHNFTRLKGSYTQKQILQAYFRKKKIRISKRSYFIKYFTPRMFRILKIHLSRIFTRNLAYRFKFIKRMMRSSQNMKEVLRKIQIVIMLESSQKKHYSRQQSKKEMVLRNMEYFLALCLENLEPLLRFAVQTINLVYIYRNTLAKQHSSVQELVSMVQTIFIYIFLVWNLWTIKMVTFVQMRKVALYVIMPVALLRSMLNFLFSLIEEYDYRSDQYLVDLQIFFYLIHTIVLIVKSFKGKPIRGNYADMVEVSMMRLSIRKQDPNVAKITSFYFRTIQYVRYIVSTLYILVSIYQPSLLDVVLIFMMIVLITQKQVFLSFMEAIVYYTDFVILLKILVLNFINYGIMNNVDLLTIVGLASSNRRRLAYQASCLYYTNMFCCWYVKGMYFKEHRPRSRTEISAQILAKNGQKKPSPAANQATSPNDLNGEDGIPEKRGVMLKVFAFIGIIVYKYSLLFYHCVLMLMLTLDHRKDLLTLSIAMVEFIVIPLHLSAWASDDSSNKKQFYSWLFFYFKPLFFACMLKALLRYCMYFMRFYLVKNIVVFILFRLFSSSSEASINEFYDDQLYFHRYFLSMDMSSEAILKDSTIINDLREEFLIIVFSILTYLCLKYQVENERSAGEDMKEIGLADSIIIDFLKKSSMGPEISGPRAGGNINTPNWEVNRTPKERNIFYFVIYFLVQFSAQILISTLVFTYKPNPFKLVLSMVLTYIIITKFWQFNQTLAKYKVLSMIFRQLDYFHRTFVKQIRTPKRSKYAISQEMEKQERLQDQLYWSCFLIDFVAGIKGFQKRFWSFTLMPLIFLNLINLAIIVFFKFETNVLNSYFQIDVVRGWSAMWLGYQPSIKGPQNFYFQDSLQLWGLISFTMINLGYSMNFHSKKEHVVCENQKQMVLRLIDCIDKRIDLYTYIPPRIGVSKTKIKYESYMRAFKRTQWMVKQNLEKLDNLEIDFAGLGEMTAPYTPGLKDPKAQKLFINDPVPSPANKKNQSAKLSFKDNLKKKKRASKANILKMEQHQRQGGLLFPNTNIGNSSHLLHSSSMEDMSMDSEGEEGNHSSQIGKSQIIFKLATEPDQLPFKQSNLYNPEEVLKSQLSKSSEKEKSMHISNVLDPEEPEQEDQELIYYEVNLSERTSLQNKLVFIHMNKNKFYFAKFWLGLLYSVYRVQLVSLITNFASSDSILNILIIPITFIESSFSSQIFFTLSPIRLIVMVAYFILNWQVLPMFANRKVYKIDLKVLGLSQSAFDTLVGRHDPHLLILGALASAALGYACCLYLLRFIFMDLFVIRRKFNSIFFMTTTDKHLIIDFQKWKKGPYRRMNIINKLYHTSLVEIFASLMFVMMSLTEQSRNQNVPVLIVIFCTLVLASMESFQVFKEIGKQAKELSGNDKNSVTLQKLINGIMWTIKVVLLLSFLYSEVSKMYFRQVSYLIDNIVIAAFLVVLCTQDIMSITDYALERQALKEESKLKQIYTGVCRCFHLNDIKIFQRISAYIGKRKLDEMTNSLVLKDQITKVKIYPDYNVPLLSERLDELQAELRRRNLPLKQRILHSMVSRLYRFMDRNINHYRNMDIFGLYQILENRNREILSKKEVDLKFYFNQNYAEFERSINYVQNYYNKFAERDPETKRAFSEKLQEMVWNISKNNQSRKLYSTAIYIKNIDSYPWKVIDKLPNGSRSNVMHNSRLRLLNKPPANIRKASRYLFKKITGAEDRTRARTGYSINLEKEDQDAPQQITFEALKVHLQYGGYVKCKFNRLDVVLHNMTPDYINTSNGFSKFKLNIFIKMLFQVANSNIELFTALMIIVIQTFEGGLFNVIYLGVIFFMILIEEHYGQSSWWEFVYILTLLKLVVELQMRLYQPAYGILFFGEFNSFRAIAKIMLLNLVLYMQSKFGFSHKYLIAVESPGKAIARLFINQDFNNLLQRVVEKRLKMIKGSSQHIQNILSKTLNIEKFKALKTGCTTIIVQAYLHVEKYKIESEIAVQKISQRMVKDVYRFSEQKAESYLVRNFSKYSRKNGVDLLLPVMLMILALQLFSIFFISMIATDHGYVSILSSKYNIDMLTCFHIIYFVVLFALEILFYNFRNKSDYIGINPEKVITQIWRKILDKQKKQTPNRYKRKKEENLVARFRYRVRILLVLVKLWSRKAPPNFNNITNPLFYRMCAMIVHWVMLHYVCFFSHPIFNHPDKNFQQNSLIWSLQVRLKYVLCESVSDTSNCYSYNSNLISKFFYLLNCLYVLLGIWQIRKGLSILIPLKKDFKNLITKMKHYHHNFNFVAKLLQSTLSFAVSNTTLFFDDWLLLEDIRVAMSNAGIVANLNSSKNTGVIIPRLKRVSISCGGIIGLLLLLLAPLVIFSNFYFTTQGYEISGGSLSMVLQTENEQHLMDLYSSSILLKNKELTTEERRKLSLMPRLQRLDTALFRKIEFSSYSESFLETERSNLGDLETLLQNNNNNFVIKLSLEISTLENEKFYRKVWPVKQDAVWSQSLKNVLVSGCQFDNDNTVGLRQNELYVETVSGVLRLSSINKKNKPNEFIEINDVSQEYKRTFGVSLKCDINQKLNYVWQMSDKNPVFYIQLVNYNHLQELIKPLIVQKDNFSIQGMYSLIITLVFFNAVRPMLSNRSVNLRSKQIPRSQVFIIILDGLEFARREGDLIKEALLFARLIDILRDPDTVEKVTGKTIRAREDNIYNRFGKEKLIQFG